MFLNELQVEAVPNSASNSTRLIQWRLNRAGELIKFLLCQHPGQHEACIATFRGESAVADSDDLATVPMKQLRREMKRGDIR